MKIKKVCQPNSGSFKARKTPWNKGKTTSFLTRKKQSESKKRFIKTHPKYLETLKKLGKKGRKNITPETYRLIGKKIGIKNAIKTKQYYAIEKNRKAQSNRIRIVWSKDKFIDKYLKHLYCLNFNIPKDKLNNLDKEIIKAKVLLFKLKRRLENEQNGI